jgi:hypothetical protein
MKYLILLLLLMGCDKSPQDLSNNKKSYIIMGVGVVSCSNARAVDCGYLLWNYSNGMEYSCMTNVISKQEN